MSIQKVKNIIKNSNILGITYILIMYLIYFLVDLFTVKKKIILFSSYSGRQYSDSPKILYELIKEDERFSEYRLVWGFNEPDKFPEELDKLNINSIKYIFFLMMSEIWISNASIEKLVPYKPKDTYYLNTWHGVPLKKLGPHEKNSSMAIKLWYKNVKFDLFTSSSEYDEKLFSLIFPKIKKNIRTGLPRNYEMFSEMLNVEQNRIKFMKDHNIPFNARLVLYMPTFREFESKKTNDLLTKKFISSLDSGTYLLVRAHYFEKIQIDSPNVINVSDIDLTTLMGVSECLISDYSSVIFDYYYLNKPIYLYCYDLEEYISYRGMYINLFTEYDAYNLNKDDLELVLNKDYKKFDSRHVLEKFSITNPIEISKILDILYRNVYQK